jgi:general secretion pathway protein N
LVAVCCAAPEFAYTASGVNTDPAIDNPGLDITRYAMPPPDINARPVTQARQAVAQRQAAPVDSANPLWGIPLSTLTATRDRPLFTPSRRPPAPVVASAPVVVAPPPPPPALERVNLDLVGTIASETESIAVFTDQGTHDALRLRTGEGHDGWILQSVARGVAILQKGIHSETLQFPKPSTPTGPSTALSVPKAFFQH